MPVQDVVDAVAEWKTLAPDYHLYRDYDAGRHRWTFASPAFVQRYQWVLENSRENLCPAVVSAFTDRLAITGWEGAKADDAAKVFDELRLARLVNLVHSEAFRCGDGYMLAWQTRRETAPRPFYHRADQLVPHASDTDPDELLWVAKPWVNAAGYGRVNVYYGDRCERYVTTAQVARTDGSTWVDEREGNTADARAQGTRVTHDWPNSAGSYQRYTGDGEPDTIPHRFGRVPVAWWRFDADTQGGHGRSILRDVVPLQDALNKSVADLIVGGEAFAQPLRYLLNYQAQQKINAETGKPEAEKLTYDETRNRIFGVRGPGPFGQLDPPDATKLTAVQDAFALKIARVVGIPSYYFTQSSGDVPSGASLRVLSSRLTAGVTDAQQDFDAPWADLMDLLGVPEVRPQWAPAAPTDITEELEAAKSRVDIGYPFVSVARKLGEDDDDLGQIERDRLAEEALAANAGQLAAQAFREGRDVRELLGGQ